MNKDAAIDYLIVAHNALQSNDFDKAARLIQKAMNLVPNLCPRKEDLISSQCHLFARFDDCKQILSFVEERRGGSKQSAPRQQPKPKMQEEPEEIRYTDEDVKEVKAMLAKQGDHYKVLGLERSATTDDVKRAYRKLALKFHPDRNTAPHSSEAFKLVSSAYVVLSDDTKRKHYDRFGTDEDQAQHMPRNPFGQGGMRGGMHGGMHGGHFHFGGDDDMFDLFAQMFGEHNMMRPQQRRQQRFTGQQRRPTQRRQEEQNGGLFYILQILVIGFIIFSSVFNVGLFGGGQSQARTANPYSNPYSQNAKGWYSFDRTHQHVKERLFQYDRNDPSTTIRFWVTPDMNQKMNTLPFVKQNIEKDVHDNVIPYLDRKCSEQQESDACDLLDRLREAQEGEY